MKKEHYYLDHSLQYLFTKLDRGDHGRRRIQRARSGRAFAHCQGRAELFLLLWHGKDLREGSKEESYAQSITDTISVPLPMAHTGIDINVDVTDLQNDHPLYRRGVHQV